MQIVKNVLLLDFLCYDGSKLLSLSCIQIAVVACPNISWPGVCQPVKSVPEILPFLQQVTAVSDRNLLPVCEAVPFLLCSQDGNETTMKAKYQ